MKFLSSKSIDYSLRAAFKLICLKKKRGREIERKKGTVPIIYHK
jgi:hypothetical protein